ncbi:MAG: hypothetical protein K2R98_32785, partial [Gemmataceae bacterium]|nr:hypothetical protein [Gemmataceae bacterium]
MPQYTYSLQAGELTLPVLVGLGADEAQARITSGQLLPPLAWGTGVIDTGTNVTCVAGSILRQLGTMAVHQATSRTATGLFVADLYKISLSIPAPGPTVGPMLSSCPFSAGRCRKASLFCGIYGSGRSC